MSDTIFECRIDSPDQIYDGDTIQDVRLEVYIPEISTGCFRIVDVRMYGIDTPEKRPRKRGRTKESLVNEKLAAAEARQAVVDILGENDFRFDVRDVKNGKYAGRIIGTIVVGGKNLSQELIDLGHAKAYFGGKKPDWGF